MQTEQQLALKSPVMEAEYAFDERTALSLYDCLVPMLQEHRRVKLNLHGNVSIEDFRAQQKARQLERDIAELEQPALRRENE